MESFSLTITFRTKYNLSYNKAPDTKLTTDSCITRKILDNFGLTSDQIPLLNGMLDVSLRAEFNYWKNLRFGALKTLKFTMR